MHRRNSRPRQPPPALAGRGGMALGFGLLVALGAASAANHLRGNGTPTVPMPSPAVATAPATNAVIPGTAAQLLPTSWTTVAGVNPALVQHFNFIASSNLIVPRHPSVASNSAPPYVVLLNLARQQWELKNYLNAGRHYASLLESGAPQDYLRTAMLELALLNQADRQYAKALQIFAQYLKTWPEDPATPEIMLRQGLLYRQMGTATLALAKFYSVMTSALTLRYGSLKYYQRLVLHAQAEIADTHYLQGQYAEAIDFLSRLLKQDAPDLNRLQIQYKLVRSLAELQRHSETIVQAEDFLQTFPEAGETAEVRFRLAQAYQGVKQTDAALRQVLLLLQSQQATAGDRPTNWTYWQMRAGNEIGNRLYLEGDYFSALQVYSALAALNPTPTWQLPVLYQVGLVYERLQQPDQARATYRQILACEKELASPAGAGLKTVMDMARWRNDFLDWQTQAERPGQTNRPALAIRPPPPAP